jgi:hypothetical protein
MTKEEIFFHEIADRLPDVTKGKVFGAMGLKTASGKTAAIFWKDELMIKLNEEDVERSVRFEGLKASHPFICSRKKNEKLAYYPFFSF